MASRTVTYGGGVSLDGFLAASDGGLDWLHFSRDLQDISASYWKDVDTILMGRKTYTAAAAQAGTASKTKTSGTSRRKSPWGAARTYVFSRTLKTVDDPWIELVSSDAAAFVRDLKQQPGKGICLMGGGELARSLLAAGLVDEIGLNIHPILLGSGVPVFRDPGQRVNLSLLQSRPLAGGCVLATYRVLDAG